jgi:hypothetical protein
MAVHGFGLLDVSAAEMKKPARGGPYLGCRTTLLKKSIYLPGFGVKFNLYPGEIQLQRCPHTLFLIAVKYIPPPHPNRIADVHGEAIASSIAKSIVNQVISRRFVKKQQMRWQPDTAHLRLQVRTRTLNGTLRETFQRWWPAMAPKLAPALS